MNVAVCCPGPSPVGERVRAALEPLRVAHTLTLFGPGEHPLGELSPRDHERLLVPIADDPACAPFVPLLREVGGTVWLHAWSLRTLAQAHRPALATAGLAGKIARWREGGLGALRGEASPLNHSVVRFGDAFVVHEEETRKAILVERNAPTPTSLIEGDHQLAEALEALPPHRSNRKSLIANAIEASDRAREARRAGTD